MQETNLKRLYSLLKKHEGLRLTAYRCPTGALTIGYGHNLDARPLDERQKARLRPSGCQLDGEPASYVLTEAAAEVLLRWDVEDVLKRITSAVPCFNCMPGDAQAVLADMAYNMGVSGLKSFKRMLRDVRSGDWATAADEMLDSRWAGQVGRRAKDLAEMMRGIQ